MDNNNTPLVSVMIPVYNGMPLLQYSIKSLINQTYTNWECIIVDDGSTDGTLDYLKTLVDPRFKVYSFGKNKGRANARQKALDEANGEFIAMLDADDLYHPEKIEHQVKFMLNNPDVSLVSSDMCSFGLNCNIAYKRNTSDGIFSYAGTNPPHASSMMRTSIAKQFRYNQFLRLGEDADFLDHYLKGRKFAMQSDVLYFYSELDSVTKKKLENYYIIGLKVGLKNLSSGKVFNGISLMLTNSAKLAVAKLIYPFVNIQDILKRRGIPLKSSENQILNRLIETIYPKDLIHRD